MQQVLSLPMQLGPVLRSARRASGLSQAQLASRVRLSQSRMSHMELNPGSLSVEQLLGILGLLGMELVVQDKACADSGPPAAAAAAAEW